MKVLPEWEAAMTAAAPRERAAPIVASPIDASKVSFETLRALDAHDRRRLAEQLYSADISALALSVAVHREPNDAWHDIRTARSACLGMAALIGGETILRAAIELQEPEAAVTLNAIFGLRTTFVMHDMKPVIFASWSAAFEPDLPAIFDTRVAAACLHLGKHHKHRARAAATDAARIRAEQDAEAAHAHLLSLRGQCEQYRLTPPGSVAFAADREPATSAIDAAVATLDVYRSQQADLLRLGLHAHLFSVELPFAIANARMEWNGVHVDPERRENVRRAAENASAHYAKILVEGGVNPPGSRDEFMLVMGRLGLAKHLSCTKDRALEAAESLHPLIRAFRLHRRYSRLAKEPWLRGAMVGSDGRVHPRHTQLGAATGRNSCSMPNIAGIGRAFRPVVTAPSGRALIELDYSQIDVAVAAAEYGDLDLIAAYNSGDVYAATAQRFYADDLSAEERALAPADFKRLRADLRERMKTFVLAVIYNISASGIAQRFGITLVQAQRERERFLSLFPRLRKRLDESDAFGMARGYATIVGGLRREIDRAHADQWTHNVLRNTPIQGSAAVVFKRAIIDLDRAFLGTSTKLVLPLHDSILIECNGDDVDAVSERAAQIMRDALRSFYPALEPKVEVNKTHPECWNKDGHADSVDRVLADPTFNLDRTDAPEPVSLASQAAAKTLDSIAIETLDATPIESELATTRAMIPPPRGAPCYACSGTRRWRRCGGSEWFCARCAAPVSFLRDIEFIDADGVIVEGRRDA